MTEKILIIAEKPSVASDIAKSLPDKFNKTKTHYEGDRHIISFAIGHLVSICYPEEINSQYQKWNINDLPIIPEVFPLKVLEETKSQFTVLQKLIRRKDVDLIINACDAGREGELIFTYILRQAWNTSVAKKTFKRLWLQSMTNEAIKQGFSHLRDDSEMRSLEDTALCRSESDWLIGINATRALTGYNSRKGGFFLTPCGRVQTPTLSLMVKRERVRQAFVPKPYILLTADFAFTQGQYSGKWVDSQFKPSDDPHAKADRIWDPAKAQAIIEKCSNQPAKVQESSKKNQQRSPQLFDLTSLQREANSRFGFSAKNTLSLAQSLYERHKVLTYPRTDSRYLPEDYIPTVKQIFTKQQDWRFGNFARIALEQKYIRQDKRIFDNSKVTDHHAIIPTNVLPQDLSEPEMKIYQMVLQRFLAVFFPAAVYLNTHRLSIVNQEHFVTEGKILVEAGWKAIYGAEAESDGENILQEIPPASKVQCSTINREDKATVPPPRFTEATLLSAMENSGKLIDDEELAEAMKDRGLGTPATRAAIIEKLIHEKYLVREGKELAPTGKAFELLSLLEAMHIEVLASPEMTGEWELKLNQILTGQMTRDKFMEEIRELTRHITQQIKEFDSQGQKQPAPFAPINGQQFFATPTAYVSEDSKIQLRKILGGRVMSNEELVQLLEGKTIGPFADFRSKKGKQFTASLRLDKNKVEFLFADTNSDEDKQAIKKSLPLGNSPIDGTPVFETPTCFLSESALDGDDKKGLRVNKIILSKELTASHIRQMLTEGKTELIRGFISKKRRPFDAYLIMDKAGKISFEFPPRVARQKKDSPQTQPE